ncbi:MAG: hypothetical protein R3D66_06520 [Alphaproteobacteria bacterium]
MEVQAQDSITKELVQMMGGTIGFDSAEGKGTTFYVVIPVEIAKGNRDHLRQSLQKS